MEKRKATSTWEYWKWTHQTSGDERKKLKKNSISNERENFSKLNSSAEISSKGYLSGPLCKILRTILKVEDEKTSTNEAENNKQTNKKQNKKQTNKKQTKDDA